MNGLYVLLLKLFALVLVFTVHSNEGQMKVKLELTIESLLNNSLCALELNTCNNYGTIF